MIIDQILACADICQCWEPCQGHDLSKSGSGKGVSGISVVLVGLWGRVGGCRSGRGVVFQGMVRSKG